MKNLENQNSKLREQRHDYLNQLQIVYGLLELEEYTEARDYLDPVFKDIMKVNRALKTSQPAVNALLQAKMDEAESQDIDFVLPGFSIPGISAIICLVVKSKYRHNKLLVKGKESMSFVEIPEIILIQRENHATVIYTEKDSYVTSASLSDLEKKLDPDQFLRSHKSYIINLHYIRKIEPYGRWTYIVQLKGRKEDALLTAEKYEEIKKRFL